ncbi:hypothetical protein CMI42_01060 [Candidatus Pacearchaeota archaeon]|nr:hypothetical protein [Candidatus Pacearchaeota archaeon]
MFSKKCSDCENDIKDDFDFCPFCGNDLKSEYDKEDYGFLGKNDVVKEETFEPHNSFMDKMFNSALKLLEKQMKNLNKEMMKDPNLRERIPNPHRANNPQGDLNVQFFVNGKKVFPSQVNHRKDRHVRRKPFKINNRLISEKIKKHSDLPKEEPQSRLSRASDKIIYDLYVPGVRSMDDVLINQLESSIEIKALSKDKIYKKNINLKLPILRCDLNKDFLKIELGH